VVNLEDTSLANARSLSPSKSNVSAEASISKRIAKENITTVKRSNDVKIILGYFKKKL
jgi:hypothetical protein